MQSDKKTRNLESLLAVREEARAAGKTVVHCHGCFDIVHPGHIQHLQFARSLGDMLIVTVSADSHVAKGIDRPLIPDDLRASSLAALECVDWVHVNPHPTAVELLARLQPDIYVKGREYERNTDPRFLAERQAVEQAGGRVVFSSGDIVYSSTALIDAMAQRDAFTDEKVARFRQRFDLTAPSLNRLLQNCSRQNVLVIGDYIQDIYHFCDAGGVAGEAPMMALRHLESREFDGGAAVIALHCAGLGASTRLLTALTNDEASQQTILRLRAHGVDADSAAPRRQIVAKNRYLVDQTKLFKVDRGSVSPIDSRTQRRVEETILAAATGATAIIFADFGYGLITESLLDRVLPELRKTTPIISADVSGRQSSLLHFREVDLICPTEREVRETLHDFSSGMGAVAWNLLEATAARQAIITLGKQGLVTFGRPAPTPDGHPARLDSHYLPALAPYAIDPLGCGDALLATASLALAAGGSLQAAAYLGAVAAAHQVRQLGNPPINIDKLTGTIQDYPIPARKAS